MTYKSPKYHEPKNPVGSVAELFAGVGGFRIGLAEAGWSTVFSNQWEPATKAQHASDVYIGNFGPDGHSNEDIATVSRIPKKVDLLVGGFPCQDYSVAKSLNSAKGLQGRKGVLWWEILRLVNQHKPRFIFLENVDRLLKSPASQKGRDFAVMLRTLGDAGYFIEWRIVNAADYGNSQRRIRVFIIAKKLKDLPKKVNPFDYIVKHGVLARALPIAPLSSNATTIDIDDDATLISNYFGEGLKTSPFLNAGVYYEGQAHTLKVEAKYKGKKSVLKDIVLEDNEVPEEFWIPKSELPKWEFLKGAKSIQRVHKDSGTIYNYAEGKMAFPDLLTNPSRTILTAEGGSTPSRFKHIIKTARGYRRLTPVELERLNGFPDDWTKFDQDGKQLPDTRRAFFMGNALVIPLITKVGKVLAQDLKS